MNIWGQPPTAHWLHGRGSEPYFAGKAYSAPRLPTASHAFCIYKYSYDYLDEHVSCVKSLKQSIPYSN